MSLPDRGPNTTVLVTGASAGIGAELARRLAERGHGLTLVARRRERLDELASELRNAHGVDVHVRPADLSEPAERRRLVDEVLGSGIEVIGLCNNAGYGSFGPFHEQELDREMGIVELNVDALHHLTGAFVRPMVERGEGAILNVASTAAFQPIPGMATYAATKAFVLSFSEAIHGELSGTGVSVTALCPGPVKTEFAETAGVDELERRIPNLATVPPAEVARQAVEAMEKGRRSVIPGIGNRVTATAGRYVPRTLLVPVASVIQRRLASKASSTPARDAPDGQGSSS